MMLAHRDWSRRHLEELARKAGNGKTPLYAQGDIVGTALNRLTGYAPSSTDGVLYEFTFRKNKESIDIGTIACGDGLDRDIDGVSWRLFTLSRNVSMDPFQALQITEQTMVWLKEVNNQTVKYYTLFIHSNEDYKPEFIKEETLTHDAPEYNIIASPWSDFTYNPDIDITLTIVAKLQPLIY